MRFQPVIRMLMVLLGSLLVACEPADSLPGFVTPTITNIAAVQAADSSSAALSTPTAIPEKQTISTSEAEFSPKITPHLPNEDLQVIRQAPQGAACSPLAGIGLDELPSIISAPYDPPPAGKEDRHHGVDFSYYRRGEQSSIQGTIVQAILPGVIAMALTESFPYGNVVIVESDPAVLAAYAIESVDSGSVEGLYTLYAHLEKWPEVQVGEMVEACQPIGAVGKSGNAGVAHLHLETRLGPEGVSFSQMGYYLAQSTDTEKENYLRWRVSGDFRHFNPMTLLSLEDGP